jgi:hypothetical protein
MCRMYITTVGCKSSKAMLHRDPFINILIISIYTLSWCWAAPINLVNIVGFWLGQHINFLKNHPTLVQTNIVWVLPDPIYPAMSIYTIYSCTFIKYIHLRIYTSRRAAKWVWIGSKIPLHVQEGYA